MYEQFNGRHNTDGLPKISIFDLKQWGFMEQMCDSYYLYLGDYGGYSPKIRVEVYLFDNDQALFSKEVLTEDSYLHLCDPQRGDYFEQKIKLNSTYCNFGGHRYWLSCPSCNKMVGVIYYYNGKFACRHCHNLIYRIRNLSRYERMQRKIISDSELERMESKVKRKQYNGVHTKKYGRYLQKKHESRMAYNYLMDHMTSRRLLDQILSEDLEPSGSFSQSF